MESVNYSHVTLVVDPEFGQRSKAQAEIGPLWVIWSPKNTAAIKELWASGTSKFENAPTWFDAVPGRTPEDSAAMFIGTVDEHHPDWSVFEVIGVGLSQRLLNAIRECASGTAEETAEGFVFTRQHSN